MEIQPRKDKPSHAEIAALAEKIYLDSGCVPGRDEQNWLLAEAQLKQGQVRHAARSAELLPSAGNSTESRSKGDRAKPSAKNRDRSPELMAR